MDTRVLLEQQTLFKNGGHAERPGFKYMEARFGRLENFSRACHDRGLYEITRNILVLSTEIHLILAIR